MKDLTTATWIKVKGILFLLLGLVAAALLILECPNWKVAGLLTLAVWCFCRFYYFAFYVIEKYVDPRVQVFRAVVVCLLSAALPAQIMKMSGKNLV